MPNCREFCYDCYRPQSSCVCKYITPIQTKTKFVILMHPKEYRKTKNTTGHLTHKSLINSHLYIGIDFTHHVEIQALLKDENSECFLLYPNNNSINLNHEKIESKKNITVFIIDSTWACSRKILRVNPFFKTMRSISFENTSRSKFHIKTQPNEFCLSTIESTLWVLKLLTVQKIEALQEQSEDSFLLPFHAMVEYQLNCAKNNLVRYKKD